MMIQRENSDTVLFISSRKIINNEDVALSARDEQGIGVTYINKQEAQQIVEHLTKVFEL